MKRPFRLSDTHANPQRDVRDELDFHLEQRAQEFVEKRGMSIEDARRAAIDAFGDVGSVEAECRDVRTERARDLGRRDRMRGLVMDVTFAMRTLWRSRSFAISAVLTLALGIGAASTAFTIVNGVLLRPLPYANPERLAMVWTTGTGAQGAVSQWPQSAASYLDIKAWSRSFESLAAFRSWPYTLGDAGEPEALAGSRASPELFATLGVRSALGRTFTPDEAVSGAPKVAVIGHDLWQRRFGGTEVVLGKQVTLSGERHTIIGVMPRGFAFPRGAELPAGLQFRPRTEIWTPLVFSEDDLRQRGTLNLAVVGRLAPDVSSELAVSDLRAVEARFHREYPEQFRGLGFNLIPLPEQAAAPVRRGLLLLLGGVVLVLLIACANVVNLLIVRTTTRDREFALRAALGAGRGRIARQLITENLMLTLLGGVLGLVFAAWGSQVLLSLVPGDLPRADDITVDWRVLAATIGTALLAGALFGVAAAAHVARGSLSQGLHGARATTSHRHFARRALVVGEVALSIVLLAEAGLLTVSFIRLNRIEPGFTPDRALSVGLLLPIGSSFEPRRDGAAWAAFFSEFAERLGRLPGVVAAGGVSSLPLSGALESAGFRIEGQPLEPGTQNPSADYSVVTPGYFKAMDIPLTAGRMFDARDAADAPKVLVISEAFARRFWPGEVALGKRVMLGINASAPFEVVGVVGDVRQTTLDVAPSPAMYFHIPQQPYPFLNLVVRSRTEASDVLPAMRAELATMRSDLALRDVRTLDDVVGASLARQRFSMIVVGAFAAAALALAMIGLYGVLAYGVAQRSREIGVRIALGAGARDVLALVVGEGMRVSLIGVVIGLGGAVAASRLVALLVYDARGGSSMAIYAGVAVVTAVVALAASYIPARRATRLDPTVVLRGE